MQGIVLAIIISTLSPEGMNGATAALCLPAKPLGLFGALALFSEKYTTSSLKTATREDGGMSHWISIIKMQFCSDICR